MDKTYRITNDRYSNNADEVTLDELKQMCEENGWDSRLHTSPDGERIVNRNGETVAMSLEAIAEMDAE